MADVHGSPADAAQNPQATSAGSAPVPYQGADQSPEPPDYGADLGPVSDAAGEVMSGIPAGNSVFESAAAHDIAAGLADAPYYPGPLAPIDLGPKVGPSRDDVAGDVAGAVANATERWHAYQRDISPQGIAYGDLMIFPDSPLDPGAGVGNTLPTAGFYDPDREYGGAHGAPGYQGEAL